MKYIFILLFAVSIPVFGEPWLGNRYAQNCAACHAPSRRNVTAKDRRCTLACQGCHANPNGGGLRNQYGVWAQTRWLRSVKVDEWRGGKSVPAPLKYQQYSKQPRHWKNKRQKLRAKRFLSEGPELVVNKSHMRTYKTKYYDRSDKQEKIVVKSRSEFLARVTQNDPWRLMRRNTVIAGGDFRYIYGSLKGDSVPEEFETLSFPMSLDINLRARPVREKLSFVFESRFSNGPSNKNLEDVSRDAAVRSLYVIIDDLPYATYIMSGLYRPLFGEYTADHTTLASSISGLDQNTIHRVTSIGGSPNVPFVNLHLIQPMSDPLKSQDRGFALNLGGRFVTLGASIMGSYWKTKAKSSTGDDLTNTMYALTGGMMWKSVVVRLEMLHRRQEFDVNKADSGNVRTLRVYGRLWRENYLTASYANADLARNLGEGSGTESTIGIKAYLLSGTKLDLRYILRKDVSNNETQKTNGLQAQVHFFF